MSASARMAKQTVVDARCSALTSANVKFKFVGKELGSFRQTLLGWYDQHRRDLPWRKTKDPYHIWLSEIMLQQTRVAAVLDHYRIFLERFPTVQALADASEDAVLAAWSGLGYYRRARMLHKCAQEIVEQYDGKFPSSSEALFALPGIGRYTAAAVASIAFAEPVAVVDGNVERVLQRLLCVDLTKVKTCWAHAEALLDRSRPGDFNQAMMELGATVCLPRGPRCGVCAVRKSCVTRGELPRSKRPERQAKKQIWCTLEWRDGDGNSNSKVKMVKMIQRPTKDSLMAGMWELPQLPEPPSSSHAAAHWRTFHHSITVTNYSVHVLRNTSPQDSRLAGLPPVPKGKWVAVDRLHQIPITGLTRKILKGGGII
jgi:A/G-specific adenine glycosylase